MGRKNRQRKPEPFKCCETCANMQPIGEGDHITIAQCKYQAQLEQYRSFSKAMGLEEQTERIYTGRTPGRISPSPQVYAQWQAEQAAKAANRAKERAEKQRRAAQDAAQKGAST